MRLALAPQWRHGMKALLLAALLLAATPQPIEFAGTPLPRGNREALEASLRRALPPDVGVRVVVIDREVETRSR